MKIKTKIYSSFLIVIIVFSGSLLFHLSEMRNAMIELLLQEILRIGLTRERMTA